MELLLSSRKQLVTISLPPFLVISQRQSTILQTLAVLAQSGNGSSLIFPRRPWDYWLRFVHKGWSTHPLWCLSSSWSTVWSQYSNTRWSSRIGAAAASQCHSHSNTKSELQLQPTPHPHQCQILKPLCEVRDGTHIALTVILPPDSVNWW